jgi:quercetin dioxygenase-like cupin family protein
MFHDKGQGIPAHAHAGDYEHTLEVLAGSYDVSYRNRVKQLGVGDVILHSTGHLLKAFALEDGSQIRHTATGSDGA